MTELPPGWTLESLSNLVHEIRVSVTPEAGKGYQLWSVPSFADRKPERADGSEIGSAKRRVQPRDVLVCKINPRINRVWIVGQVPEGFEQIASPEWLVLRTPELGSRVIPEFLRLYLTSPAFRDWVVMAVSGVTGSHTRAKAGSILKQMIPVPSLDEQRRIVDILEDHLSRLDAAVGYLAAAEERVNSLQMGLLASGLHGQVVPEDLSEGTGHELVRLCGGDPSAFVLGDEDRAWSVPSSWAWTRIADLFEVYVGSTPSRANKSLWGGELAWVSSGEVAFNRITSTRETVQLAGVGNPLTRIHEPGTVMLAMIGEGKTRGQAAILGVTAAHNQNCASIRVARTPVLSEYVFSFLRERYIETRRTASGGNQPALNKGVIGRIAIPIPPLGTQRRLVAAFQEAEETGDALKRAIQNSRDRAGLLRNSLLASAFSGRMTGHSTDMEIVEEMASV